MFEFARRKSSATILAIIAMASVDAQVQSAEIKVIAASAVKDAYTELVAGFEMSSGHKVSTIWAGTESAATRVIDGEICDIVIIGSLNIDQLIAAGKLASGSRADLAKSRVGIAVRAGLPKPDVSTSEAVKIAVLAAGSVAYSKGPSGAYIAVLLRRLGIA